MRPVHGHALRLVDGGGIAVVEVAIILNIERYGTSIIRADGYMAFVHLLDAAQRPVLHLQAALIAQEHDAVARRE